MNQAQTLLLAFPNAHASRETLVALQDSAANECACYRDVDGTLRYRFEDGSILAVTATEASAYIGIDAYEAHMAHTALAAPHGVIAPPAVLDRVQTAHIANIIAELERNGYTVTAPGLDRADNVGNTCDDCGILVEQITGCPDGAEVCSKCADNH